MAELILASASPRRRELLRLAGLDPVVRPAAVDEAPQAGEGWQDYLVRVARDKAFAVAGAADGLAVLAADTEVIRDGAVLGKPRDAGHAHAMLRELAGRSHTVATGVAVVGGDGMLREAVVTTRVVMGPLSEAAIAAYVATGEPLDKAGGYGIQGPAAVFVERIEGSWTNVVGLPVVETLQLLRDAGVAVP